MFIVNKSSKMIHITLPVGLKRIPPRSYIIEPDEYHRMAVESAVSIYNGNLVLVYTKSQADSIVNAEMDKLNKAIPVAKESEVPSNFETEEVIEIDDIENFLARMSELSIETKADLMKDISENPDAVIERVSKLLTSGGRTEEQVDSIKKALSKSPDTILDAKRFHKLLDEVNMTSTNRVVNIDKVLNSKLEDSIKLEILKRIATHLNIEYNSRIGIDNLTKKIKNS